MRFIQQKYGNDGYATWIKILRELAVTDFHYLNVSEKNDLMDLSAICLVDEEKLLNIITDLSLFGQFNDQLWKENKVIFSEKFILHIQDAYKKRNNNCITLKGLEEHLQGLGVRKLYKPLLQVVDNPQTKVEYSKVKKIIYTNSVQQFLIDLPNSSNLDTVSILLDVPKEKLIEKIATFKGKTRTEYKNFVDFVDHFKMWYSKEFIDKSTKQESEVSNVYKGSFFKGKNKNA